MCTQAYTLKFFVISMVSILAGLSLCFLLSANTQQAFCFNSETKQLANIPRAEDYESAKYLDNLARIVNKNLGKSYKANGDWARIGIIINKNGSISHAWIFNSSGRESANAQALRFLQSLKLPPLEAGSPGSVKAYCGINLRAKKSLLRKSLITSVLLDKKQQENMFSLGKNSGFNIAIASVIFLLVIVFYKAYELLLCFCLAGIYWWTHRILLGKFPS